MFNTILQIIMATLGTLAFCLTFNVNKKHIIFPTIGGGLCWGMYLLFQHLGLSVFPSTFFACAIIGIYGEVFSHIGKYPTTVNFIPSCVPLIPGSNLYYALLGLIKGDTEAFATNTKLLILYAVGIAVGLWFISEIEYVRAGIARKLKARA